MYKGTPEVMVLMFKTITEQRHRAKTMVVLLVLQSTILIRLFVYTEIEQTLQAVLIHQGYIQILHTNHLPQKVFQPILRFTQAQEAVRITLILMEIKPISTKLLN